MNVPRKLCNTLWMMRRLAMAVLLPLRLLDDGLRDHRIRHAHAIGNSTPQYSSARDQSGGARWFTASVCVLLVGVKDAIIECDHPIALRLPLPIPFPRLHEKHCPVPISLWCGHHHGLTLHQMV